VPKKLIAKAIGKDNINLKKLSSILKRRIRMIALPKSEENIEEFIKAIVSPLEFKNLEVNDEEIILTAGAQSKAALLGRNKRRYQEMQKIIESFFRKSYKIV
jgi:transcription antitermination factor NusA-like protein